MNGIKSDTNGLRKVTAVFDPANPRSCLITASKSARGAEFRHPLGEPERHSPTVKRKNLQNPIFSFPKSLFYFTGAVTGVSLT